MNEMHMGAIESRFADIIWENEPISSIELSRYGLEKLNWKKTTCYTVLKRLCDKGIFRNTNGTVTSVISRRDFYAMQSEKFVEDTFGGSLPAFLAAFTARKSLSAEEVSELRRMIEKYGED